MASARSGGKLLALEAGDRRIGLPAALVREVARLPRLARVPHAPPALMGLANVRGAVLPVLSLARLFDEEAGGERRLVVIDAGEPIGLAVRSSGQLVEAGDDRLEEVDIARLVDATLATGRARRTVGGLAMADSEAGEAEGAERLALTLFAIGAQEFALPLGAVEEVIRRPAGIAGLPDADAVVIGSASHRGALLPLLSLGALLGLPGTGDDAKARVVVVRIGTHKVGLLVDAMRDIVHVSESDVDAVPQVLARGAAEARIQAILRLDEGRRLVSVLAAEHLLREDITARLLKAGTGEADEMVDGEADGAAEQFLLFRIGGEDYGLPIGSVEEVAPLPSKLTRLPKAPPFVKGVMNLRGRVVPVIDQAARFGGASEEIRKRRVVVVRIGDLVAGFIVDQVSEVLRIAADALRPAPDLGDGDTRIFERVANFPEEDRIVLIVSPRELLDRAEQDLLRGLGGKGAPAAS